jgi:3',5'-cyclic AMP phosphodiesterase CpdA
MTISHSANGQSGVRLVHVSDSHLSRTHSYFDVNWSCFREAMAASPPDMLVHGGDISFNGPSAPLDLAYAADEIAALGLPWRAIPGNHDIGEAPDYSRLNQHINREKCTHGVVMSVRSGGTTMFRIGGSSVSIRR